MKTKLLFIILLLSAHIGYSQCSAESEIDENFNGWTEIDSCWSTITAGALLYNDSDAITYYSFMAPNTDMMLVTPEMSAGTYDLSFDITDLGSTNATIQIGILTDNTDASTFTTVGAAFSISDSTFTLNDITIGTGEYLAFSATFTGQHHAFSLDNVRFGECIPVTSIDESFDGWTEINPCWSTITAGALLYNDSDAITYYSFMAPNTDMMLVTPEIFSGTYDLSFGITDLGSTDATIQIGILTDNTDASTFTTVGAAFSISDSTFTLEDITIGTGEYLAFSAIFTGQHHAFSLDNVSITDSALSVENFNQLSFAIFPNPSTDKKINLVYDLTLNESTVSVFNITGAKVFETSISNNAGFYDKQLDLSDLKSGIYILNFKSGDSQVSKRIILN